jgi:urea transport system permease protein
VSESTLVVGQLFNGISVASILLLAALGLALSFGLMRVINMAHGEMLMMGGYLTYLSDPPSARARASRWDSSSRSSARRCSARCMEVTLIRRFYGRPLDTLLATWGVSLILQQAARSIFGPIGVEVTAPPWLSGTLSLGRNRPDRASRSPPCACSSSCSPRSCSAASG